jgi:predicted AlkP superfamily pyrophosphatase or phosphodiesterase
MKPSYACGWIACWLLAFGSAAAEASVAEASVAEASVAEASVAETAAVEAAPVVVLLSWDGVRHDLPDLVELPGLQRLAREGVRAGRLIPVFPSNTFPTHVSLATGTHPDRHGIIDNRFIDPVRGAFRPGDAADWLEAEPLWIAAERQGVSSATYFWVGSESDWRGQGTRYRIAPFDDGRPEAAKVDQILAWLALPAGERPRLIMSYWRGADSHGHRHGPDASQVLRALEGQDTQLQRLLDGLDALDAWPLTTLIVVSDHGMTGIGRHLDLQGALAAAGIGARVTGGAVAQVYLDDPAGADAALAVAAALTPVRAYKRDDAPHELRLRHPRRSGDLLVITEPPYSFSRPAGLEGSAMTLLSSLGRAFGGHGYEPTHPDMAGIFLALGRGVAPDTEIAEVHQVDVAATVARLLGIDPPADSEGSPVPGIGIPEADDPTAAEAR